jgi:hypothetical protein
VEETRRQMEEMRAFLEKMAERKEDGLILLEH